MEHWIYEDVVFEPTQLEDWVCFVYLITDLENGEKVCGKKELLVDKTSASS